MKLTKIILGLALMSGIIFSCNRDETNMTETINTQQMVESVSTADLVTDDNSDLAMDFATTFENTTTLRSSGRGSHPDYPCAVVTVTSTNGGFPKTITVDFGTGCTDRRGITRKGKIIMTITDRIYVPGATLTVTRENFYVGGTKVEGEFTMENMTTDPAIPTFRKAVSNGKITREDGSYYTFNSSRKYKMIEGVSTRSNIWDDVWEIYDGTQTVNRSNGSYLTSTIKATNNLIKKNVCRFISRGSIILKGSKIDGVLDFGNGDCDNQATFTAANGTVYQISLR